MNTITEKPLQLIRRWGSHATDALLDPRSKYFYLADNRGLIGYREFDQCRVAYGDPVCQPSDIPKLVEQFHQDCQKNGHSYIFLAATKEFALWYFDNYGGVVLQFGELLSIDPLENPQNKQGSNASLVRRKTRHAIKENVKIQEYHPTNFDLENKIETATQAWILNRKGPQVHFSDHRIFEDRLGKRWFYATVNNEVVGSLTLNRLEKENGWLLNHLTYVPNAPHGTQELLIINTLETLAKENCRYVSFGATPAEEINDFAGLSRILRFFIQKGYKIARTVLHIEGHKKFWEKFDPNGEPAYLVFSNGYISLTEVKAIKQAMNISFF